MRLLMLTMLFWPALSNGAGDLGAPSEPHIMLPRSLTSGVCVAKTAADVALQYRTEAGCPSANPTSCVCTPSGVDRYDCPGPDVTAWQSTGKKCSKMTPDMNADWDRHPGGWDYPADYFDYCPPPNGSLPGSPSGFSHWIEPGSYACTKVDGVTHEWNLNSPGFNSYYNTTSWCYQPGCWVSPCTCNMLDMAPSSWIKRPSDNGSIYYSYGFCGGTNAFTEAVCDGALDTTSCGALGGCKWVPRPTEGLLEPEPQLEEHVSTELDSSPAALAGAHSTVTIGSAPWFWSGIPSDPTSYAVSVGDKLSFKYNAWHNVWLLPSWSAFENCDFSGGVQLATNTSGGGNGDVPNLYEAVVTRAGTHYVACQQPGHCANGQKITIVSTPSALDSSPAALADAQLTVTIGSAPWFWSGIPSDPTSYEVNVGDKLSFKYNAWHNVWLLPSWSAFENCDFSGGVQLATNTSGGGSGDVPNLYEAVVTRAGTHYVACQQPGHCANGQKITIAVALLTTSEVEVPTSTAPVTSTTAPSTSTTVLSQSMQFQSLDTFTDDNSFESAFASSFSSAAGVSVSNVNVQVQSVKLSVTYSNLPSGATDANVISAIASANNVLESSVESSATPSSRRLAMGRILAETLSATITLTPSTHSDLVSNAKLILGSLADTQLLAVKISEIISGNVSTPVVKEAPVATAAFETSVATPEGQGGQALANLAVVDKIQTDLGGTLVTDSVAVDGQTESESTTTTTKIAQGFSPPGDLVVPPYRWTTSLQAVRPATTTTRGNTTTTTTTIQAQPAPVSSGAISSILYNKYAFLAHLTLGFLVL